MEEIYWTDYLQKLTYLSRIQLAAVYALVCSMRNIRSEVAEKNLTDDARNAVREVVRNHRGYFDRSFHDVAYIDGLARTLNEEVDRVQLLLAEMDMAIRSIQEQILGPAKDFVNQSHRTISGFLDKSSRNSKIEYNPALRYLRNLTSNLEVASAFEELERGSQHFSGHSLSDTN